jgi:cytochrome c oxidase subunit 1
MKKSSSRGFTTALGFFVAGLVVGTLLGVLLHTLTTGQFSASYFADLPSWLLGCLLAVVAFLYGLVGYSGVVRGLLWQVAGTLGGAFFVSLIRLAMGLKVFEVTTFGFSEPAWVVGGLVGAIAFLAGVGAITDWFKWALGQKTSDHHEDELGWQKYFGVSLDHKVIGIQYTFTSLLLLSVGGSFALIFRTELSKTGMDFLSLQLYNTLMSLHGMVMIVSLLLGVSGVVNYLVPMLIGARDMAFPRLNAFSFWIAIPAAVVLLSSLALGGFDTGWTGYPPLSVRAPLGM